MNSGETFPVGFVAHGAPTLAIDAAKGAPLKDWAASLPRPAALLIVSAHWEAAPLTLSSTARPKTIHDFGGFPDALYAIEYAAPGAPGLADRVEALLPVSRSERGLDHGVWVPLLHMVPAADVPTLQLSMPRSMTPRELFEVGAALAPLRDEGVWILGSGNVTHNLGRLDWTDRDGPPPAWAVAFDDWIAETLEAGDVETLLAAETTAPGYREAHPTDEHLRPLFVVAGAGRLGEAALSFPLTGFEYGSLSRRCVQLG